MAASITALEALTHSVEAWDEYQASASKPVDLTLAQLRGVDLHGRSFSFCDLSGADLGGANLDQCSFSHASLKDTSLRNASMVSCQFDKVDATNALFEYSVIRDSKFASSNLTGAKIGGAVITQSVFNSVTFERSQMDGVRFSESSFGNSDFRDIQSTDVGLKNCEMATIQMFEINWSKATLIDCEISGARLRDVELTSGLISSLRILDADLTRFSITDSEVDHLDFSRSNLREIELSGMDLPRSTMLDTAVIHCRWPPQAARVSWTGRYYRSPLLLGQPVQDLRGLSPSLRREIADAQYLDELAAKSKGWWRKLAFRIWGATTAYGQSISRLSTVTLLIIVLFTLLMILADPQLAGWSQKLESLPNAIKAVSARFLGIEGPTQAYSSRFQDIVLVISRVSGFFVMGLWIGVAANRLGRLSSE